MRLAGITILLMAACGAPDSSSIDKDNNANNPTGQFGGDAEGEGESGACVKDPSFYDVPGDKCDNDGDGKVDNPPSCDGASGDTAVDFARALGICDDAATRGFGLVSAEFTQGHGVADAPMQQQHGILSKFGNVLRPREGKALGALSTGFAQEFDGDAEPFSPGREWWDGLGVGAVPAGFPKAAEGCEQSRKVNDVISLKLELKAPKNAKGLKFDFNFHSSEWPSFICSSFNDGFIAYLSAKGFNGGTPDNISFDAKGNPVSVNNGFLDRCTPAARTGCSGDNETTSVCAAGEEELDGTGFGIRSEGCDSGRDVTQGGATGWLTSQATIDPEETFTLELMIWDSGDGSLDSLVLLDNFQWIGKKVKTSTERPPDVK